MFPIYPYIDLNAVNLDWIIKEVKNLRVEVETMQSEIGDVSNIVDRVAALEDYCNRLHNGLNSQFDVLTQNYTAAIAAESNNLIDLMDNKDQAVKDWTVDQLAGLPGYYMYNPYTGVYSTITDVMMYLYESQRVGITAAAYDALDMTATYYDGLQKTAYDYDINGI